MKKPRRHFGTDQKATILKRCLVDKVPISDLCDESRLENKLQQKNEVISELMEKNVRAKKANGEL